MGVSKVEIKNADGTKNVLVDLTGDTVTADKMLENETAHGADGEPITGTIVKRTQILSVNHVNDKGVIVGDNIGTGGIKRLGLAYYTKNDSYFGTGTYICTVADYDNFGDATAEDVVKGKTFTSVAGFKVTGTAEASVSNDNCEAYHITDKSTALNFKRTDGDIKVWGYGFKSSGMYQKTTYAFCGDGYYAGSSYMNPTKTSVTWSFNTDGTLSGLPGGLTALDVLVTKGI